MGGIAPALRGGAIPMLLLAAVAATGALPAARARANGRMPGATELTIGRSDPDHLLARATFGLVQSFDRGASWQWICEQAVDVSGEADPPIALTAGGSLVLLPPAGGTLLSHDGGCTWSPAPPPLRDARAIDLTLDPSDAARVVIATSTIDTIDDRGLIAYTNLLVQTNDDAETWTVLSTLPSDFKIETLEIAPSDPDRIYVSGTASESPLLGVLERSEDGGASWTRTMLELPPSSGSLFIGAIDPTDPDRLWVRLPAQGDQFGLFSASLLVSSDKGASFEMLAATDKGMLGFAVSPDGTQLAYGGPADGLRVGPSDGSGEFTKVSDLRVRCLRWNTDGLYACGTEPVDPFSVGLSSDGGASFAPVYTMADTCPQACTDASAFAATCEPPWRTIGPAIAASAESCAVSWARPPPGPDAGGEQDARDAAAPAGPGGRADASAGGTRSPDAAVRADADADAGADERGSGGCACAVAGGHGTAAHPAGSPRARALVLALALVPAWRARRRGARVARRAVAQRPLHNS